MLGKRTKEQVEQSVKEGDYTGGYNFVAWMIWMRTFFTCTAIPLAIFIFTMTIYLQSTISTVIVSAIILSWSFFIGREYRNGKKGKAT